MRVTENGPECTPGAPTQHPNTASQLHPPQPEGVFNEKPVTNTEAEIHEIHGLVSVGNGTTHYKGYFPENRTEPGIGYLFHGFGGFLKSSEPLGKALAAHGLANIIVDQSHLSGSALEDLTDSQKIHVETAEAVFADLPHNGQILYSAPEGRLAVQEQRLISAHSMGGLAAARFAEQYPDDTETLALLKTVGVHDPIIGQILASLKDGTIVGGIRHELLPYLASDAIELNLRNVSRMARYMGIGWPILRDRRPTRAIGEMLACLQGDTREALVAIGEQGTRRLGVEAGRDPLIRFSDDIVTYLDRLVRFDSYGHLMPQHRPMLVAKTIIEHRADLQLPTAA